LQLFVKFRKLSSLIRLQRHIRRFTRFQRPFSESVETPAIVGKTAESKLRQLAIADHVNAGLHLFANDVCDSIPQPRL